MRLLVSAFLSVVAELTEESTSLLQAKLLRDVDTSDCKSGKCEPKTTTTTTSIPETAPFEVFTTTLPVTPPPNDAEVGMCVLAGDPHIKTFDRGSKDTHFYNYGDYWIVKSSLVSIQGRYWSTRSDGNSALRNLAFVDHLNGNSVVVDPVKSKRDGRILINGDEVSATESSGEWESGYDNGSMHHKYKKKDVPNKRPVTEHEFSLPDSKIKLIVRQFSDHLDTIIEMPHVDGQAGHCGDFDGNSDNDAPSYDMIPSSEVLFEAAVWDKVKPSHGECEPALHAKAVNHCMQLWQGNDDDDETDLEACVQDVCFGDEGIADAMMGTDKVSKEEKAKLKAKAIAEKEAAKQKKAEEKAKNIAAKEEAKRKKAEEKAKAIAKKEEQKRKKAEQKR